MKIHYFFKEIAFFSAVFIFFIMPSVVQFEPAEGAFSAWNFPAVQLVFSFFSFFFVHFELNFSSARNFFFQPFSKEKFRRNLIFFISGLALLLISAVFFQFAAGFFPSAEKQTDFIKPENLRQWVFCILSFFSGAILEENIFRFYLPAFFRKVFPAKFSSGFLQLIPEFFPCVLFALCHRYLGIFAVLNAFSAHAILRLLFYRTSSPLLNYSVHFFYNILNVLVMVL